MTLRASKAVKVVLLNRGCFIRFPFARGPDNGWERRVMQVVGLLNDEGQLNPKGESRSAPLGCHGDRLGRRLVAVLFAGKVITVDVAVAVVVTAV